MSEEMIEAGSEGMADFAESIGEGELYAQAVAEVNGEEYIPPNENGDSDDHHDDNDDIEDENDNQNNGDDEGLDEESDEESGEDKEDTKKPWEVEKQSPEIFQSDEFKAFLEASGKTQEEFVKEVQQNTTYNLKIRGRNKEVPFDKVIADAQIAGASMQKSARMNAHIKDGILIEKIRSGGEEGMLALKTILSDATNSFKLEDVQDLVDNVLDTEGEYDDSKDLSIAEKAAEVDRIFGDVVDNPEYNDTMASIQEDIRDWLPEEVANDVANNLKSLREYYDIKTHPEYPNVRQLMEDRLSALPSNVENSIRSNAKYFIDMFDDTVKTYSQSLSPNQNETQSDKTENQGVKNRGNSKTVRPPRSRLGKRAGGKGSNADSDVDFMSMTAEELDALI